ncbi:MAG TPA: hypothetical protein VIY66_01535 [Candidatus Acidoferrales bacterium]
MQKFGAAKVSGLLSAVMVGGLCALLISGPRSADAVPSFSRQTGFACSSCHTNPPELTPLGRAFKLNGYTMQGLKAITSPADKNKSGLSLLSVLPLSAQIEISNTGLNKKEPATQNWSTSVPQDASIFLAGSYASHLGGFVQVTYDAQADHFSWDNTDVRYANTGKLYGKPVVYGIDINNNPTVEDLWNSTPAWGFPWNGSSSAPGPSAAAVIDGTLAADVAGVGGYAMFNDHLYAAGTIYTSAHLGNALPNTGVGFQFNIQGAAPYWRLAWQQSFGNNYLEVGGYGMHVSSTPNTVTGPTDDFTDAAVDAQWERVLPKLNNNLLTIRGTYIHESQNLNATFGAGGTSFLSHDLNTFRVNAAYHFGYRVTPVFGYFATTGTSDPLLYAPAALTGSATGSPNSQGFVANITYWPVQNIRLALQYTAYTKFNGAGTNYDGFGRNASDNNSLYLHLGVIF